MSTLHVLPDGTITSPAGFEAAGVACGLKADGALDLALLYSERPCTGAGVFTTNAFRAAPVMYDRDVLAEHADNLHGVVINSGCANACTGPRGLADAQDTAAAASALLGRQAGGFLVMSTGVIGKSLCMDRIHEGLTQATRDRSASEEAGHRAARAIMTTDTRPKEFAVCVSTPEGEYTVAGMAKGAGMIHPNMATLLCAVTTDAALAPEAAQRVLRETVDKSFNMITIDGDTSTNDSVLLLANGAAGLPVISEEDVDALGVFEEALGRVVLQLAKEIVRDGEGATRFVALHVEGARTAAEAKQVAMSVARSPLVKTAIYGADANWGRIVCAVGYSGVDVDPDRVSVSLSDLPLFRNGSPTGHDEGRATELLSAPEVTLRIQLGDGPGQATVWTCDLTHKYVDINAHYRT